MRKSKYIISFVISIILLIIFKDEILISYGSIFTKNDEKLPSKSAVVVLGGNLQTRINQACNIFKSTNAKKFLFFQQPEISSPLLRKYAINETILTQKIITNDCKITHYDIISLPDNKPVTSTLDEAKAVKLYLKDKSFDSIILVTDNFHSLRAYTIFSKTLEKDITVYMSAVFIKGESYNDWWTTERGIKFYLLEVLKFLNYYMRVI